MKALPGVAATLVGSAPYRTASTGGGNSYAPVFSANGKHVAFVSHANNLVTNDDLGPHLDLFVRDLVSSNTVLVSVSTNGFGGANDNIGLYTLSSNAQVVAFETLASNLAPGDTNRWRDIYVRDLVSGVTRLITSGANGHSSNPLISEDGRRVIFESLASNLVTNDFNGTNDIFIHDLTTGGTELVTLNSSNTSSPNGPSYSPSISADGLKIAFASRAKDIQPVSLAALELGARSTSRMSRRGLPIGLGRPRATGRALDARFPGATTLPSQSSVTTAVTLPSRLSGWWHDLIGNSPDTPWFFPLPTACRKECG
ncbi:MAG: PD40 domain-containing protein [Verrucomicrobia bacterium]|nr:PD40 domain-containing protein [Verrucomicrobiota bacterium]